MNNKNSIVQNPQKKYHNLKLILQHSLILNEAKYFCG